MLNSYPTRQNILNVLAKILPTLLYNYLDYVIIVKTSKTQAHIMTTVCFLTLEWTLYITVNKLIDNAFYIYDIKCLFGILGRMISYNKRNNMSIIIASKITNKNKN